MGGSVGEFVGGGVGSQGVVGVKVGSKTGLGRGPIVCYELLSSF